MTNPALRDVSFLLDHEKAEGRFGQELHEIKNRPLTFLTFALNYRLGGLNPWGYHAVNMAIHILNAFMVYMIITLTFRTPRSRIRRLPDNHMP